MEVLLISARGAGSEPHWSRQVASAAAKRWVEAGHRVRWLCAANVREATPVAPAGAELVVVVGRHAPFRRVQRRVSDWRLDLELARLLRPRPAELVLHIGFGAPGSVSTLWIADRMGARVGAVVRAAEVLCHRGTLWHGSGTACAEPDDPARCTACCLLPTRPGLTPLQAALARALRSLGGLSPFPSALQFQNRFDLTLASLQLAAIVIAPAADHQLLQRAGVAPRSLVAADPDGIGAALPALVGAP